MIKSLFTIEKLCTVNQGGRELYYLSSIDGLSTDVGLGYPRQNVPARNVKLSARAKAASKYFPHSDGLFDLIRVRVNYSRNQRKGQLTHSSLVAIEAHPPECGFPLPV